MGPFANSFNQFNSQVWCSFGADCSAILHRYLTATVPEHTVTVREHENKIK
jgi:hypothetical protein